MNSSYTIPAAILIGGAIIVAAVLVAMPKNPQVSSGDPSLVRPVSATDHVLGNPAAPVVIIEYSDFNCQYCKTFHETMHQIIANEGASGKVAWVYRHFPLIEIPTHKDSPLHARAAECAATVGGNDAFWKFADALFANQPANPSRYGELAASIGVTGDAFATCYANNAATLDEHVTADRQNARDIGAGGTPFSIMLVNGANPVVMDGAYPYDAVKQLIDQALAE